MIAPDSATAVRGSRLELAFGAQRVYLVLGSRGGAPRPVRVSLDGGLKEQSWFVFEFVELKAIMRALCGEIDHLVLLPLKSDRVRVVEDGESVSVSVDGKPRYVFPRKDCALLPIPNTTVEMLAQLLTERLQHELQTMGAQNLSAIEMEVEENFGQSAVYRLTLG